MGKTNDARKAIEAFNTVTGHTKIVKSGSKLKVVPLKEKK